LEIIVDARAAETLLALRNGGKRMAFAISNAIRTSLLGAQAEVRKHVEQQFIVRRAAFVMREAAVIRGAGGGSGFPSTMRLEGRFQTGEKERFLLGGFETGELRRPFTPGAKHVAVPTRGGPARPTPASKIPQRFQFSDLALRAKTTKATSTSTRRRKSLELKKHITSGGKTQYKGASRTFLLTHAKKAPFGGVYQRVGAGRDDIRLVYSFQTPRNLPAVLKYDETARRYVEATFESFLIAEVAASFEFHKGT
jgi:hypothetical protein